MIAVWDPGVRLFHWLLVAAVGIAGVTGLFGPLNRLSLHVAAGVAVGGLLIFRMIWGFAGATYARFSSFTFRPSAFAAYVKGLQAGAHSGYLGHNPLGAAMVLALLAVLALNVTTGVIVLGGVDKQGPLAFAVSYETGTTVRRIHQTLAYVLLVMIVGHLTGVIRESFRSDTKLVLAMITGEKSDTPAAITANPARARPALAVFILLLLLTGVAYEATVLSSRAALGVPTGSLDSTYVKECGSCHMAYPPSLGPSWRWIALMGGLSDHFGEDASLEPNVASSIRTYLINNSAEKWDTRPSHELAEFQPRRPASPNRDAVLDPDPSVDSGCCFQVEGGRREGRLQRLSQRRNDWPFRPPKNRDSCASSSMRTRACSLSACFVLLSSFAFAEPGDTQKLLDFYAKQAKAADTAFAGFSAQRGELLFRSDFSGGKPDTPSCTVCHTKDPRNVGQTRAGKDIDPMAASANPHRYTDQEKTEKWFGRNCRTSLDENAPQGKRATSSRSCLLNENLSRPNVIGRVQNPSQTASEDKAACYSGSRFQWAKSGQ